MKGAEIRKMQEEVELDEEVQKLYHKDKSRLKYAKSSEKFELERYGI